MWEDHWWVLYINRELELTLPCFLQPSKCKMDRRKYRALALVLLTLTEVCFILSVEARLIHEDMQGLRARITVREAQNHGPSPGGGGHGSQMSSLGGMKESVPSPGQGNGETLKEAGHWATVERRCKAVSWIHKYSPTHIFLYNIIISSKFSFFFFPFFVFCLNFFFIALFGMFVYGVKNASQPQICGCSLVFGILSMYAYIHVYHEFI